MKLAAGAIRHEACGDAKVSPTSVWGKDALGLSGCIFGFPRRMANKKLVPFKLGIEFVRNGKLNKEPDKVYIASR